MSFYYYSCQRGSHGRGSRESRNFDGFGKNSEIIPRVLSALPNNHFNIYRKHTGERHYSGGKGTEAEIQDQGQ